ncbi:MAG: AAA family ATPase [Dehalococcoidia bacterium]
MLNEQAFLVVRGPALSGKTSVARAIARQLAAEGQRKVACISQDDLWSRWIVGHDSDLAREAELVYRQIKLLSASYVRGGYHVIVDAAFAVERDGAAATHDSDLRDLLALVATIPNVRPLLVVVTAPLETLLARARDDASREERTVEAVYRAFEMNAPASPMTIDTSRVAASEAARIVLEHIGARP